MVACTSLYLQMLAIFVQMTSPGTKVHSTVFDYLELFTPELSYIWQRQSHFLLQVAACWACRTLLALMSAATHSTNTDTDSVGINRLELRAFCDRLLHSLLDCSHPNLVLDIKRLTISYRDVSKPRVDASQRLPLVLHALCCLSPDLFIGPTLFARCMHHATSFLEAACSEDFQQAINASSYALTMLSALKVLHSYSIDANACYCRRSTSNICLILSVYKLPIQ
jgi:hypothetical protein